MAKRSVKRERARGAAPQPPPPEPEGPSRRQFWLGVLVAAAVLIPLAVVGIVLAASGDEEGGGPPAAAATPVATPTAPPSTEELEQQFAVRDSQQVTELTELARKLGDDLDPVLAGINETLPLDDDDRVGRLASTAEAERWLRAARTAAELFEDSPSGETATNVARGALAAAVRGIERTADTYLLALQHPETRTQLLESTRTQRDNAMRAWETAGIQLDVINIDVGFGHQHPPIPGTGGRAPDSLPEGTDSRG
jgi:hypothetical protein